MNRSTTLLCLLITFALPCALGQQYIVGIDTIENVTSSEYTCLVGKAFAIINCFNQDQIVSTCSSAVTAGWSYGLLEVGISITPCVNDTCNDPVDQMKSVIQYIYSNNVRISHMWIEVTGNWTSSTSTNQQILNQLFTTANNEGVQIGIFTSQKDWYGIMGQNYQFSHTVPLWYYHIDNMQSFGDYRPFGGWQNPTMKRFKQNVTTCGVFYNVDYRLYGARPSTTGHTTHHL
eukprot:TRINITY_DN4029_c1_g1_i1.p1 TRINITY_DN4029_c1_g1~~TRINITY_DN4029_c1_g1_i1.p1  ORF type:complete len:232 (-),score=28.82 TRINITY_DN4029_c1_g1_i1:65-760(-)